MAHPTGDPLEEAFRKSPQVMGLLTPRGEIVDVNPAALAFLGAARDDLRGRVLWELPSFTAATGALARAAVADAARGQPQQLRLAVQRDGAAHSITATVNPATRDGCPFVLLVGGPTAESDGGVPPPEAPPSRPPAAAGVPQALQGELLGAIVSVAADAIIAVDADERIVFYNQGAEQIFGWTADEMAGQPLTTLMPARYHVAHRDYIARFGAEPAPARLMAKRRNIAARRKSGAEFPAEASIAKVDTPAGRFYTVVLRDVSERMRDQRNERVLAEAGARLAGLPLDLEATLRTVANLPVPLLADWTLVNVVDGETVHRAASNHQDPRRDAVLRDLERLKPDYDALAPLAETVATGRARLVERIDGAWIAEHLSDPQRRRAARLLGARSGLVVPLVARGRVLGTLMLVRATPTPPYDAADLALAEAIAQRAALAIDNARLFDDAQCAAQLRDEVLGVVSHDLRTPVTAIDMCARALLDQQPDAPPEVTELYCAIRRSARWAQHIIGDLLDVASIEAGRLSLNPRLTSPARVTDELREVFAPLAAERGVTFAANVAPDLPRVWADPERLVQALGNLLGNGIKFTPAGGSVALDVAGSEGVVCFTVTDTGPGISAAELPHVFDRFWRGRGARTGGAGLGLTIVKALADLHGALLTVESAPGRGTTCTFTIPIATVDAGLLAQHDEDLVTSAGEVPRRD